MIRVAVMYPRTNETRFDYDYYIKTHMKLVKDKLSPLGMLAVEVDKGLAGMGGGTSPYYAVAYLVFESVEAFQAAFDVSGEAIIADVPNYTTTELVVQISEIVKI